MDLTNGLMKLDRKLLKYLSYVRTEQEKLMSATSEFTEQSEKKKSLDPLLRETLEKQNLYPTDTLNFQSGSMVLKERLSQIINRSGSSKFNTHQFGDS